MSKETVKVNLEDKDRLPNEIKTQDISLAGQSVNSAVKKIVAIGEIFAENNPELKTDMYEFSKEARDAGKSIQHLCESNVIGHAEYTDLSKPFYDHNSILLASKSLLSSITRVLLLVDIVIVKQLLTPKKKVTKSLKKLESIMHFADFVRSFAALGVEMLKLMYMTTDQHNSAKEEHRQAQMYSAKQILERSIATFLTSSKTAIVHSDCVLAKENRDTVFCQIRRAMDLIHFVIKDSIYDSPQSLPVEHSGHGNIDKETVLSTLKHFASLIEKFRVNATHEQITFAGNNNYLPVTNTPNITKCWSAKNNSQRNFVYSGNEDEQNVSFSSKYLDGNVKLPIWLRSEALGIEMREQLLLALDKLLEKTYDFTDSAYTSQENRENILLSCDRCKIDIKRYFSNVIVNKCYLTTQLIDDEIDFVLNGLKKLLEQLVLAVIDQAFGFFHSVKSSVELVNIFYNFAIKQDINHLEGCASIFNDHCDHIIDVCKLLRHIALTEALQVQATCLTINLRIYGPQVLVAAKILCMYPDSKPANENFDAFVEMWKWLTLEVTSIAKDILKAANELNDSSLGYLFLRKQKSATSTLQPCGEGQAQPIKNTLSEFEMKGEENECTEKWNGDRLNENNDIIKRAKNMSAMAFSMYQFTKGSGNLRTTQDLFTQAEYFAEEANCLYKVLRQFSYQVPASQHKKDLLNTLDRVPTFVQTLQFTVKDHTVGKAATFVKVDHVIRETKNLMNVINKVVATCFECANKYKLEFTGLSDGLNSCSVRGNDSMAGGIGDSKGTTNSSEGSM